MSIKSAIYILTCFTILIGISGTPSSVSKAHISSKKALLHQTTKPCKKAIIFDLGEVLITRNYFEAFKQLYIPDVFYFMFISRTNPLQARHILQERLYEILNRIKPATPDHPATLDEHGNEIPELLHMWLAGTEPLAILKEYILATIDDHSEWFNYDVEKRLIKRMITMLFTPQLFAQTRTLINGAFEFVQECKDRGYKIYVLSNWDAESIHYIYAQYPELFDLFDGICISGEEGYTKPDVRIYKKLLEKYALKAHECWFIDDQQVNITGALHCNISGIVCPQQKGFVSRTTDFDALRLQLI